MQVTEFKEYKACPYRYYLKYRVKPKLESVNDADTELTALSFGNLIHKVLEIFGQTESLKHSTSAEEIRDFLVLKLRELIRQKHGEHPRPVIAIQAERAIKRLEAFADWQAHWATEHEILATELKFEEDRFTLDVGDQTMGLRGRIDRIDRNKRTNELVILDNKTGSSGSSVDPKQHRNKEGEWVDFQLPLYYHLLGQHEVYAEFLRKGFRLGYIILPSDVSKTGNVFADWDRPMVLSAIEEARNIVRDIWANKFDKVSPPPMYSEAFAAICNDF
jgi:ATP-dependent helicase/DNAse subunit B